MSNNSLLYAAQNFQESRSILSIIRLTQAHQLRIGKLTPLQQIFDHAQRCRHEKGDDHARRVDLPPENYTIGLAVRLC